MLILAWRAPSIGGCVTHLYTIVESLGRMTTPRIALSVESIFKQQNFSPELLFSESSTFLTLRFPFNKDLGSSVVLTSAINTWEQ